MSAVRESTNLPQESRQPLKFACDAMCGGLVRWLRALGYDTTYTAGIDDAVLVRQALDEDRILITSDGRLFERKVISSGQVRAFRLPRGLKLLEQVRLVAGHFGLRPLETRCTMCNGELIVVTRQQVGDAVPARSLLWASEFYRCGDCGKVYWNGSHWQRIERVRAEIAEQVSESTRHRGH